jgi:hypothetical protein
VRGELKRSPAGTGFRANAQSKGSGHQVTACEAWDRNRWSVVDPAIALAFRQNALFGPLIDWVALDQLAAGTGTTNPTEITTGREALPGHINQNAINPRAKYITADYLDSRERKLRSRLRLH